MSSEDVLLKIDTHYCKSWLEGCRCGNDQLRIPCIRHVLRSIKQTKITTYSNGQMQMYSECIVNCTFIFKCVTYDHTSKICYLMEGVFDVVHLYIRKILCYDTPNLSTQYPSCSSLFISSFVYYTIDFQVTCLYYREGNLWKGDRVNNLFFHQPIT